MRVIARDGDGGRDEGRTLRRHGRSAKLQRAQRRNGRGPSFPSNHESHEEGIRSPSLRRNGRSAKLQRAQRRNGRGPSFPSNHESHEEGIRSPSLRRNGRSAKLQQAQRRMGGGPVFLPTTNPTKRASAAHRSVGMVGARSFSKRSGGWAGKGTVGRWNAALALATRPWRRALAEASRSGRRGVREGGRWSSGRGTVAPVAWSEREASASAAADGRGPSFPSNHESHEEGIRSPSLRRNGRSAKLQQAQRRTGGAPVFLPTTNPMNPAKRASAAHRSVGMVGARSFSKRSGGRAGNGTVGRWNAALALATRPWRRALAEASRSGRRGVREGGRWSSRRGTDAPVAWSEREASASAAAEWAGPQFSFQPRIPRRGHPQPIAPSEWSEREASASAAAEWAGPQFSF
jgi:hypothetical protein